MYNHDVYDHNDVSRMGRYEQEEFYRFTILDLRKQLKAYQELASAANARARRLAQRLDEVIHELQKERAQKKEEST